MPTPAYEVKTTLHSIKSIDDRSVTGVFAVHGNIDDGGDRTWPGAFNKTFAEQAGRIRFLWQHDTEAPPVAVVRNLREISAADLPQAVKDKAPAATGGAEVVREYLDTPRGNEILTGIKSGAITEMSYMYSAVKYDFEEDAAVPWGEVRNVREMRLYECSDVNWGLNPATVGARGAALLPPDLLFRQMLALLLEIKEGRRNNATDQQTIDAMHDLLTTLGPTNCKGPIPLDADEEGKSRAVPPTLTQAQRARLLAIGLTLPAYARL